MYKVSYLCFSAYSSSPVAISQHLRLNFKTASTAAYLTGLFFRIPAYVIQSIAATSMQPYLCSARSLIESNAKINLFGRKTSNNRYIFGNKNIKINILRNKVINFQHTTWHT